MKLVCVLGCLCTGVVSGQPVPPFQVPDEATRLKAIGVTQNLSLDWRRALEPAADDFRAIEKPRPGDWLEARQEFGQTFGEYLLGRRNAATAPRRTVYLVPLGDYGSFDVAPKMETLAAFVRAYYRVRVSVLEAVPVSSLRVPSRRGRGGQVQLHSPSVLDRLEGRLPADGFALVGVTMVDLYPAAEWNYVFGQARAGKRVGVFSFARYDPRTDGVSVFEGGLEAARLRVLRRSCKVLAHEVGHLFGMSHCIYFACVMNGSNHLAEADSRPMGLCPVCLRKAGSATAFRPAGRYAGLALFYRKEGLDAEAEWCERRVVRVNR